MLLTPFQRQTFTPVILLFSVIGMIFLTFGLQLSLTKVPTVEPADIDAS